MKDVVSQLKRAHANGHLLAHMFEFDTRLRNEFDGANENLQALLDVMSCREGAVHGLRDHHVDGHPEGFVGLPTTALHKDFPVKLYSMGGNLGMLFDGQDSAHVKPILVGSSDLISHTRNGTLYYGPQENFPELQAAQGISSSMKFKIDSDLPEMKKKAKAALPILWEQIREKGWDQYTKEQCIERGMNEVSVVAHLKGVKGLIVSEIGQIGATQEANESNYKRALFKARKLRDWLSEEYPQEFPEKLPVMSYNPQRTQEPLVEVSEERLRMQQLPFSAQEHILTAGGGRSRTS